jgi:hypothetical protein
MSKFLYFIPHLKGVNDEEIKKAGILENSTGLTFEYRQVNNGPDGNGGVVFGFNGASSISSKHIGFFPDKQEWSKCNDGKFWLGVMKDDLPTPEGLRRIEQIHGHNVKLEDGKEWTVPLARVFPAGTCLPEALILSESGEVIREIIPRYAKFGAKVDRVWKEFQRQLDPDEHTKESNEPLSDQEEFDVAVEALAINYLVSKWEVAKLRLLTTENLTRILYAVIDIPTIREVVASYNESAKKKDIANIAGG